MRTIQELAQEKETPLPVMGKPLVGMIGVIVFMVFLIVRSTICIEHCRVLCACQAEAPSINPFGALRMSGITLIAPFDKLRASGSDHPECSVSSERIEGSTLLLKLTQCPGRNMFDTKE